MKKLILLLTLALSMQVFGQKYIVTPEGLRDVNNVSKTYIVYDINGLSTTQLYENAINYVNEKYKNPEEVIKGKIEGEYLKFDTYVSDFILYNNSGIKMPIQANFTTQLRFKDGKVKYEISSLDMKCKTSNYYVLFSGGMMQGYIIYKKNGKLFKEKAKLDIEKQINIYMMDLLNFLKGEDSSNDNW